MAVRGLGKGLDALIPSGLGDTKNKEEKQDVYVDINKVEPNREQPRKHFDEDALLELAESIKQHGVIQPILVQDRNTYYEIIAGERRALRKKMLGDIEEACVECAPASGAIQAVKLARAVSELEKASVLMELNMADTPALEQFMLNSLRIWMKQ